MCGIFSQRGEHRERLVHQVEEVARPVDELVREQELLQREAPPR